MDKEGFEEKWRKIKGRINNWFKKKMQKKYRKDEVEKKRMEEGLRRNRKKVEN